MSLTLRPGGAIRNLRIIFLFQIIDHSNELGLAWENVQMPLSPHPDPATERVRQLRRCGHLGAAYEMAKTAFGSCPTKIYDWVELYDLAMKRDSLEEVERLLQIAPAENVSDDVLVLCARAELASRRNRRKETRSLLQKAFDLDPGHQLILSRLFYLSIRNNAVEEAKAYYRGLCELRRSASPPGRQIRSSFRDFDGQILNDMLVDAKAMAQLAELRDVPTAARIASLLPLARLNPDHIPTANMITVSLREGGYFSLKKVSGGKNNVIPKIINQYQETTLIPADLQASCESWKEWNSNWSYRYFDDAAALQYLSAHFPSEIAAAYNRSSDLCTKADLLRLAVLTRDGGVWADIGDYCQQPLEWMLTPETEAVFWQEQTGHIGSNFIAVRPGHPILQRALAFAVEAVNRGDQEMAWLRTGPGLLTRAFAVSLANDSGGLCGRLRTVKVIDEFELWRQVAPVRHWCG